MGSRVQLKLTSKVPTSVPVLRQGLSTNTSLFTHGGDRLDGTYPLSRRQLLPQHNEQQRHDLSGSSTSTRKIKRGEEKKCIKCREIKPLSEFGKHGSSEDDLQSICRVCKNERATERRNRDVRAKLHHHIATRVSSQLGNSCPKDITKTLEERLGYRVQTLVRHLRNRLSSDYPGQKLRNVLNDGWHVDHIHPLMAFKVVLSDGSVDWEQFQQCWALDNLVCVPAEVNLAKGAKIIGDQSGKPF